LKACSTSHTEATEEEAEKAKYESTDEAAKMKK
jgi:hypothetical protein